jgi:hypothetical protein
MLAPACIRAAFADHRKDKFHTASTLPSSQVFRCPGKC